MDFRYSEELRLQFIDNIMSLKFDGQMNVRFFDRDDDLEIERTQFLLNLRRDKQNFLILIHNSSLITNMTQKFGVPERNLQSLTQAGYLIDTVVKNTRIIIPDYWQTNVSQINYVLQRPWKRVDVFATRL